MKARYEKPLVKIERFAITQSIAAHCGYSSDKYSGHPTHADKNACGWDDGYGEVYWTSTNTGCNGSYSEDSVIGEVCYNNPNGGVQIFAS